MSDKPRLEFSRPIIYATSAFPPRPGGSAILNRNLLTAFSPESITLVANRPPAGLPAVDLGGHQPIYVTKDLTYSIRVNFYWSCLQNTLAENRIVRLAHQNDFGAIVGAFPHVFIFRAALRASRRLKLPFIAYLHDTLTESLDHKIMSKLGKEIQEWTFKEADKILVMSQGMADLYRRKYNLDTTPLVHSLPEPVPAEIETSDPDRSAFWGGSVYDINDRSVLRIYKAITRVEGYKLFIASNDRRDQLIGCGMDEASFILQYIPDREIYLDVLKHQAFLILALNWADETDTHEDELATIFPTKTIEYLASGRPILVHCPEDYFLARFFREHRCAEVVTERSVDAIHAAVQRLITDKTHADDLARRALETARMFSLERVAAQFHREVEEVLQRCEGLPLS